VDTQGDSLFYVFPRALAAVAGAAEAQRALAAHDWPEDGEIRVRIGINTGEASLEDGRYVGFAVHRAARISAAAHGGQTLVSSTTRELVSDDLPPGQVVRDLGERRLKDLPRPERLYQLVVDDLPSEFAPPRTLDEQELAEAAEHTLATRRYRRRAAVVIPAAVLAGAAVLAAVLLLLRSSDAITAPPNSVAIIDPAQNKVVGTVPVGIRPSAIAFGAESVWVANAADKTLSRIDPETRQEGRFPLQATPTGVAVQAGAVWTANGLDDPDRRAIRRRERDRRRGLGLGGVRQLGRGRDRPAYKHSRRTADVRRDVSRRRHVRSRERMDRGRRGQ
jgi:YVTN family beta-propeller protein